MICGGWNPFARTDAENVRNVLGERYKTLRECETGLRREKEKERVRDSEIDML